MSVKPGGIEGRRWADLNWALDDEWTFSRYTSKGRNSGVTGSLTQKHRDLRTENPPRNLKGRKPRAGFAMTDEKMRSLWNSPGGLEGHTRDSVEVTGKDLTCFNG